MLTSAMTIKSPAPGYKVPGLPAPAAGEENAAPAVQVRDWQYPTRLLPPRFRQ